MGRGRLGSLHKLGVRPCVQQLAHEMFSALTQVEVVERYRVHEDDPAAFTGGYVFIGARSGSEPNLKPDWPALA